MLNSLPARVSKPRLHPDFKHVLNYLLNPDFTWLAHQSSELLIQITILLQLDWINTNNRETILANLKVVLKKEGKREHLRDLIQQIGIVPMAEANAKRFPRVEPKICPGDNLLQVTEFFDHLQRVGKLQGWSKEEIYELIPFYLTSHAARLYQEIVKLEENRTFDTFKAAFIKHFSSNSEIRKLKLEVENLKQGPAESTQEYVLKILDKVKSIDSNMSVANQLDLILRGLRIDILERLSMDTITTIPNLLDQLSGIEYTNQLLRSRKAAESKAHLAQQIQTLGQSVDKLQMQYNDSNKARTPPPNRAKKVHFNTANQPRQKFNYNRQNTGGQSNQPNPVFCKFCLKKNHTITQCFKYNTPKCVFCSGTHWSDRCHKAVKLNCITQLATGVMNVYTIQISMKPAVQLTSLIDTGADRSCIHVSVVQQFNWPLDKITEQIHIQLPNGERILPLGTVQREFIIDNQVFNQQFLVVHCLPTEIVLASDFLIKHSATIDYGAKCLSLSNNDESVRIPLTSFPTEVGRNVNIIDRCMSIPPGKTANVRVSFPKHLQSRTKVSDFWLLILS